MPGSPILYTPPAFTTTNVLYGVGNTKAISAVATNTMFTFNDNILYNGKVSFQGANDVVADPMFVAAGSDFHLAAAKSGRRAAGRLRRSRTDRHR